MQKAYDPAREEGKNITYQKRGYEKPYLTKEETMNFPVEIINSSGKKVVCRQCSGCHGCR